MQQNIDNSPAETQKKKRKKKDSSGEQQSQSHFAFIIITTTADESDHYLGSAERLLIRSGAPRLDSSTLWKLLI